MLVSFDIKFIGRDQKQRRNGEACILCGFLFIIPHYQQIYEGEKTEKQSKGSFVPTCWSLECVMMLKVTSFNLSKRCFTANVSISQSSSKIASEGIA